MSDSPSRGVINEALREQFYGFRGPRDHRGRSHREWLGSLQSLAKSPIPLTRQLRRAMLRGEVWQRWTHYLYQGKDGQVKVNVPCDELGPMPRRVRRSIASALFRKLETEAKAQADRIRNDPEEFKALAERFADNSRKAHDEVVRHGG